MARIKINYAELQKQSSRMANNIQTYQSLINRTKSINSEIGSSWTGDASIEFVNLINRYIDNANKMVDLLNQFIKISTDVSKKFKNVDSSSAKQIKDSF